MGTKNDIPANNNELLTCLLKLLVVPALVKKLVRSALGVLAYTPAKPSKHLVYIHTFVCKEQDLNFWNIFEGRLQSMQ